MPYYISTPGQGVHSPTEIPDVEEILGAEEEAETGADRNFAEPYDAFHTECNWDQLDPEQNWMWGPDRVQHLLNIHPTYLGAYGPQDYIIGPQMINPGWDPRSEQQLSLGEQRATYYTEGIAQREETTSQTEPTFIIERKRKRSDLPTVPEPNPDCLLPQRLPRCAEAWRDADQWTRETITFGLKWRWSSRPKLAPQSFVLPGQDNPDLDEPIQELLSRGIIKRT